MLTIIAMSTQKTPAAETTITRTKSRSTSAAAAELLLLSAEPHHKRRPVSTIKVLKITTIAAVEVRETAVKAEAKTVARAAIVCLFVFNTKQSAMHNQII